MPHKISTKKFDAVRARLSADITPATIELARCVLVLGMSQVEAANRNNSTKQTVNRIVRRFRAEMPEVQAEKAAKAASKRSTPKADKKATPPIRAEIPHPGELIRCDILPVLKITARDLAKHLGFARPHFSRVLNGHAAVSTDLADRLERAGIGTAEMWLNTQTAYDLWQLRQVERPEIARIMPADPSE